MTQLIVNEFCREDHPEHREAVLGTVSKLCQDARVRKKAKNLDINAFCIYATDYRYVSSKRIAKILWLCINNGA